VVVAGAFAGSSAEHARSAAVYWGFERGAAPGAGRAPALAVGTLTPWSFMQLLNGARAAGFAPGATVNPAPAGRNVAHAAKAARDAALRVEVAGPPFVGAPDWPDEPEGGVAKEPGGPPTRNPALGTFTPWSLKQVAKAANDDECVVAGEVVVVEAVDAAPQAASRAPPSARPASRGKIGRTRERTGVTLLLARTDTRTPCSSNLEAHLRRRNCFLAADVRHSRRATRATPLAKPSIVSTDDLHGVRPSRRSKESMSIEILTVEDDDDLAYVIAATLQPDGYRVTRASSGAEALGVALGEQRPDLIVLDVMLPDLNGFEVCQRLREAGVATPVIFLTAADSVGDKVRGLTIGGDDYLTKPFSVEELAARVRSLLRRTGKATARPTTRVGDLEIDDDAHEVTSHGVVVDLSPTEYRLLLYLMRNAGIVLSRWQILDHVWDYKFEGDPAVVESHISQLRRKIDTSPPSLIRTVRGVGYRFERGPT
jgi:two-component system, OmpR family, response regulator